MPNTQYMLLGLLSALALIGWGWWLVERRNAEFGKRKLFTLRWSPAALILVLLFARTLLGYLYYNVTFVQHQGRYLFPALIPIGLAFSIGWWQILEKIKQALARRKSTWAVWLERAQLIAFAAIFIYLPVLDLIALQRYIIPNLSP